MLHKPDLAGRLVAWSIELSEHDVKYEPRTAIKSQVLADFIVELSDAGPEADAPVQWVIYVDRSSNKRGCGAGIVISASNGISIEQSLSFDFKATNNQAEYEACLAGLRTAYHLGAREVTICSDSQLVISQVKGEFQAKEPLLQQYLAKLLDIQKTFNKVEYQHIPRESNARADVLSRLASTTKPGYHHSIIQEVLPAPSIHEEQATMAVAVSRSWIDPLKDYIVEGTLPEDDAEAKSIVRKAIRYAVIDGELYRKSSTAPLLKCLRPDQATYVLQEVHEGSCGLHQGGRALALKILRAGYYWPTLDRDSAEHVKKCDTCQRFSNLHKAPPETLSSMSVPWPFYRWGMDVLGPFPPAPGQVRFLVVRIDYFTKWIEAEALASITSARIQRFFYRNIISRFGIPHSVVTDNGTQFTDRKFRELLEGLHIKQHFSSVEHPQTNGQAEAANKIILQGLQKRCRSSPRMCF